LIASGGTPLTLATIHNELLASARTGSFTFELMDDTFFGDLPTSFGGDYDLKGRDAEILELLATFIGHALLGNTFAWLDFPHDVAGALLGYGLARWR
jgi:hypothetical protein